MYRYLQDLPLAKMESGQLKAKKFKFLEHA